MRSATLLKTMLIGLVFTLSACNSVSSPDEAKQSKESKTVTAGINIRLGIAYLQKGDNKSAKEKLLLAMRQDPKNPAVYYAMGYFLEAIDEAEAARSQYQHAIKMAPKSGAGHNNYGTFLCRHNENEAGIAEFMKAIEDPEYLEGGSAYANAGICAQNIPNPELAEQYFKKALSLDPRQYIALIETAQLSFDKGDYDDSSNKLNAFLVSAIPTPESTWLSYRLAKQFNNPEVAREEAASLLKHYPNTPEAQMLLEETS